jgi:hypothetical protein
MIDIDLTPPEDDEDIDGTEEAPAEDGEAGDDEGSSEDGDE